MSETIIIEKTELLTKMQTGYDQFESLLASLSEAQMTTPHVNGNWSVKDNIAHLITWHSYLLEQLQGVLAGKEPAEFMPELATEDEVNEHFYQENKDRALSEVLAAFQSSYQRVREAVQALSQESLNAPFPWREDQKPVWSSIEGNTFGHYEEHGNIIRHWLQS